MNPRNSKFLTPQANASGSQTHRDYIAAKGRATQFNKVNGSSVRTVVAFATDVAESAPVKHSQHYEALHPRVRAGSSATL